MNSLSWLLYVADTLPGISALLAVLCVVLFFVGVILLVMGAHDRDMSSRGSDRHNEGLHKQRTALTKIFPAIVPLMLVSIAVPSKQTILLIAASEMGEAVVKTPEAQEIFGDLKAILKKQLGEMKK